MARCVSLNNSPLIKKTQRYTTTLSAAESSIVDVHTLLHSSLCERCVYTTRVLERVTSPGRRVLTMAVTHWPARFFTKLI